MVYGLDYAYTICTHTHTTHESVIFFSSFVFIFVNTFVYIMYAHRRSLIVYNTLMRFFFLVDYIYRVLLGKRNPYSENNKIDDCCTYLHNMHNTMHPYRTLYSIVLCFTWSLTIIHIVGLVPLVVRFIASVDAKILNRSLLATSVR